MGTMWRWLELETRKKKDEKTSCQHSNHLRDDAQTCWYIMHHNARIDTSLQEKRIPPDFCSGRERLKPWICLQNMSPWWRRLWNFRDNRKQRFFCNRLQVGDHLLQRRQAAEAAGVPCWNIMRLSSRFFQVSLPGFSHSFPWISRRFQNPWIRFFCKTWWQKMLPKVRSWHWLCQGFGT